MTLEEVEKRLLEFDQKHQQAVYTTADLRILLKDSTESTFSKTIKSAVRAGLLDRVAKGIFVFTKTTVLKYDIGTKLIKALRPTSITYVSLEFALNMWSVIPQMPFVLTLMTTGRSGKFSSPYGRFEFTHTARDVAKDIKDKNIIVYHDDIGLAKPHIALRDLKRVGRNTHLVDMEAYEEALEEAAAMPL